MSARRQLGTNQQNPSGTAALRLQSKSGCTGAILIFASLRSERLANQGRPCTELNLSAARFGIRTDWRRHPRPGQANVGTRPAGWAQGTTPGPERWASLTRGNNLNQKWVSLTRGNNLNQKSPVHSIAPAYTSTHSVVAAPGWEVVPRPAVRPAPGADEGKAGDVGGRCLSPGSRVPRGGASFARRPPGRGRPGQSGRAAPRPLDGPAWALLPTLGRLNRITLHAEMNRCPQRFHPACDARATFLFLWI